MRRVHARGVDGTLAPMERIYLDHAASTPPRPEALEAMRRCLEDDLGNASASHAAGQRAREAVERAREQVADALSVRPVDVVFTSGGTEADNLAVKGLTWAAAGQRDARRLVVSAVEHDAVLEPARWLARHDDLELVVVPPRSDGRVDPERVLEAVTDDTAAVSVMAANNELGAVNDVAAIGAALADHPAVVHTDAVQAFATRAVDPEAWGVDALSLSAHKFGGPQGVGIAYLRRGVPVTPLAHGGGQDRGVRSGTFAAALDAACGAAAETAVARRGELAARLEQLGSRLAAGLVAVEGVTRNGPAAAEHRLASHVHVSVAGVDGEALTFALDRAGLMVSSGSACHAGAAGRSHVLEAVGVEADATVRLSLGWTTTADDVDRAVEVFGDVVTGLRRDGAGGFLRRSGQAR